MQWQITSFLLIFHIKIPRKMYPYKKEKDTAAAKDGYFSLCPEKDVYFYNAPGFPARRRRQSREGSLSGDANQENPV